MEGECHKSPGLGRRMASLDPGVDLELEQPALPAIEPDGVPDPDGPSSSIRLFVPLIAKGWWDGR